MGGPSLMFRAGAQLCALGLEYVVEVMRPLPVRRLEGTDAFLCGVSVVRGIPVPVISVATLLGGDGGYASRFVTVKGNRGPAALAVDAVLGVREIPAGAEHELSPLFAGSRAQPVTALATLDAEVLVLLHHARLVPDEVWAVLDR